MEKRTYFMMPPQPVRHVRTIELKLSYTDAGEFSPWIAKVTFSADDLPYYRFGTWLATAAHPPITEDGGIGMSGVLRLGGVAEGDIVAMRIDAQNPDVTAWFVERDMMLRRLEKREDAIREWYDLGYARDIPILGKE